MKLHQLPPVPLLPLPHIEYRLEARKREKTTLRQKLGYRHKERELDGS
jgi:hypothetical protein